jgi:curved DNA-binding protein CbpA
MPHSIFRTPYFFAALLVFGSSGMLHSANHYEALGINRNATKEEVGSAYRRLTAIHHPDKPNGNAETFNSMTAARDTLTDDTKRKQYDKELTLREDGWIPVDSNKNECFQLVVQGDLQKLQEIVKNNGVNRECLKIYDQTLGITLIHSANDKEMAEYLLNLQPPLFTANDEALITNATPILLAAQHSLETNKLLIARGADVNAVNCHNANSLHVIATLLCQTYNQEDLLPVRDDIVATTQLLMDNGADTTAKTVTGQTPIQIVTIQKHILHANNCPKRYAIADQIESIMKKEWFPARWWRALNREPQIAQAVFWCTAAAVLLGVSVAVEKYRTKDTMIECPNCKTVLKIQAVNTGIVSITCNNCGAEIKLKEAMQQEENEEAAPA